MNPTHKLTRTLPPPDRTRQAGPDNAELREGTLCRVLGEGFVPGTVRIAVEWSVMDDPVADTRTETRDVPADAVADLHQIDMLGML